MTLFIENWWGSSTHFHSLMSLYLDVLLCLRTACVSWLRSRHSDFLLSASNFHPHTVLHLSLTVHLFALHCLTSFDFGRHLCVCVCVSMSSFLSSPSPCVAFLFGALSRGSAICWRRCGWWVGQRHARLSSMETRWMMVMVMMMIRGYVCLTPPHPASTHTSGPF